MKKYTQKDFDKFKVIDGIKQCPSGDYSAIDAFAEGCSFAEWCSFAENIKIEDGHKLISFIGIDRIGSRLGKTYFFNCEDGLFVRCGCWFGTIEDFKQRVREAYPEGRFRKEYDMAIDYAKKWKELSQINN